MHSFGAGGQMSSKQDDLVAQAREMFAPEVAETVVDAIAGDGSESLLTLGLADTFFRDLDVGVVSGLPTVTWTGMDTFLHVPKPDCPFAYRTSSRFGSRWITPQLMPTDGGTIPYILRSKATFSSWGYAPGYIIHDWIFYAKRFHLAPDADISFDDGALIMAEVIKTLMMTGYTDFNGRLRTLPLKEDTLYLIYLGVKSRIARSMWNLPTAWDEINAAGLAGRY